MKKSISKDLHSRITQQIVDTIESGAGTYEMPWHNAEGSFFIPRNPIGNYCYHRINILSLWAARQKFCFTTNQWATYRQWACVGAQVRLAEKGTPIVFYQPVVTVDKVEKNTENAVETEPRYGRPFITKITNVFNLDQVDGYSHEIVDVSDELLRDKAEEIIIGSKARIFWGSNRACYIPSRDEIHLPPTSSFISSDAYYGVAFHELTHWTVHQSRCARDLSGRFGSSAYAMEELVAELGASFISAELAISQYPRIDHAQYISSWMAVLKNDSKAIFIAASQAIRASSYLLHL